MQDVSMFSKPDDQRTIEIGYCIAPIYQGKGFVTSATRQLIEIVIIPIAFTPIAIDRVGIVEFQSKMALRRDRY